jgi:hypothetical protein
MGNIKVDLEIRGWNRMDWIRSDRDQWRACEYGNEHLGSIKWQGSS